MPGFWLALEADAVRRDHPASFHSADMMKMVVNILLIMWNERWHDPCDRWLLVKTSFVTIASAQGGPDHNLVWCASGD